MSYQNIISAAVASAVEESIRAFISAVAVKFEVSEEALLSLFHGTQAGATTTKKPVKESSKLAQPLVKDLLKEATKEPAQNAQSTAVLMAMKKDELVAMAKSRNLSHTGTKEAIIARLTGEGAKKSVDKPAEPVKEVVSKGKAQKPAAKIVQKITPIQAPVQVRIAPNKFKNFEHTESGLVFDNINGKVIGKQNVDGTVSTVTDADIEQCKKYGFEFVMPTNLNTKKEAEEDDEDPMLVEEAKEDADGDNDVEEFMEDEEAEEEDGDDDAEGYDE